MAISSNALFHFTNNYESLIGIVKNKFCLSYCFEEKWLDNVLSSAAIPVISFCDLPLSSAIEYLEYGEYAIGLTKEWGIRNKLNPVIYLEKESEITNIYKEAFIALANYDDCHNEALKKVSQFLMEFDRYSKNFEGYLESRNKLIRFYNEREWRYVPNIYTDRFSPRLNKEKYELFKVDHPQKPHFDNIELAFEAKDIKYLMVKETAQIPLLIDFILKLPNLGSEDEKLILLTKILSLDQIKFDL